MKRIAQMVVGGGKTAPYCTPYYTGNIPEETPVHLKTCLVVSGIAFDCGEASGRA